MSKTYRVRRSADSNDENGKEPPARQRRKKRPVRWPWVILCLLGMALIVAIGISSSKPEGGGLVITVAAWTARRVTALSGSFAMFLCFMIILTSVLKLFGPDEPLPGLAWACGPFWSLLPPFTTTSRLLGKAPSHSPGPAAEAESSARRRTGSSE